jgi:hypothetical protein
MSRDMADPVWQSHLNGIRDYYLDAMRILETSGFSGQPSYRIDEQGRYEFRTIVKSTDPNDPSPFECPLALPGRADVIPFATVTDGVFGDEKIYVSREGAGHHRRFYSNLDSPAIGKPLFAFSHTVPVEKRVLLFAAMLLCVRDEDVRSLPRVHPASDMTYTFANIGALGGQSDIADFDPGNKAHANHRRTLETALAEKWACVDGMLLSVTKEPFYAVLAPADPKDPVQITSGVERNHANDVFATFAADRRDAALTFTRLLVELGIGSMPRRGCQIDLHAPATATPRNHGTEIAYAAWALATDHTDARDKPASLTELNTATEKAGGLFPWWSNGVLWIDPYGEWQGRDEWHDRLRQVSEVLGPVTRDRLTGCRTDHERSRLRLKPILDFLTWGQDWRGSAPRINSEFNDL